MRIFKDPETGEIGPPTAGSSALEMDANSEDMTGLKQVVFGSVAGTWLLDGCSMVAR